jgi:hypothetical protein
MMANSESVVFADLLIRVTRDLKFKPKEWFHVLASDHGHQGADLSVHAEPRMAGHDEIPVPATEAVS